MQQALNECKAPISCASWPAVLRRWRALPTPASLDRQSLEIWGELQRVGGAIHASTSAYSRMFDDS